jgi:hypothetical protein
VNSVNPIGQRHRDAIPVCYAAGAVAGMGFMALGASPLLGFAVGFGSALLLIAAVYSFLRCEFECDDCQVETDRPPGDRTVR